MNQLKYKSMFLNKYTTLSILLYLFLLTSCGFQLRQPFKLPPQYQQIIILSENADKLKNLLTSALIKKEITVLAIKKSKANNKTKTLSKNEQIKTLSTDTLILHLSHEKLSEQIPTTINDEIVAYDINLQVNVAIGTDKTIKTLNVRQRLNVNQDEILSSTREQHITQNDLYKRMLERIMYQVRYAQ